MNLLLLIDQYIEKSNFKNITVCSNTVCKNIELFKTSLLRRSYLKSAVLPATYLERTLDTAYKSQKRWTVRQNDFEKERVASTCLVQLEELDQTFCVFSVLTSDRRLAMALLFCSGRADNRVSFSHQVVSRIAIMHSKRVE